MSGYTNCACRDCFEIAISENDDGEHNEMCHACEEAGCEPDSECRCEPELDDGESDEG